jgi:hypothetical protein
MYKILISTSILIFCFGCTQKAKTHPFIEKHQNLKVNYNCTTEDLQRQVQDMVDIIKLDTRESVIYFYENFISKKEYNTWLKEGLLENRISQFYKNKKRTLDLFEYFNNNKPTINGNTGYYNISKPNKFNFPKQMRSISFTYSNERKTFIPQI